MIWKKKKLKDEKAYFCGFSHTPIFHRVCGVVTHFRTFYTCQSLFLCSLAEKFALEAKNNRMIVEEKGGENEADENNTEEEDDIKLCDDDKNVDWHQRRRRQLTQIWSLTRLSCRKTVFTLKSMPTVETKADVKESSA